MIPEIAGKAGKTLGAFSAADQTWGALLAAGQNRLKEAGIAEYSLDAWYLFERAFGISRMRYLMCSVEQAEPSADGLREYVEAIERRAGREPLQHILGTQEFMGLEFYVNRHVLIPRQDTETLVEMVLGDHKNKSVSVLDMCTGSGCIAVSLAKLGGYAHVEAADISVEALKVAERNAETILGVETFPLGDPEAARERELVSGAKSFSLGDPEAARECESIPGAVMTLGAGTIRFRHSDMFGAFDPAQDRFDIIVSNPPYIPSEVIESLEPEVRDFEPRNALDGTEDGLFFYRKLAEECGSFLKENGSVYFEIGHDQGVAVANLLDAHGFKNTRVVKDLAGQDRVVCGTWQTA